MEIIDKGDIPVERLFFYLNEYFGIEHLSKVENPLAKEFRSISNIEGLWVINFVSYPKQDLLLYIFAIFRSKLSHQKLRIQLDSHASLHEAGSNYSESQPSIAKLLKYNDEKRQILIQQFI